MMARIVLGIIAAVWLASPAKGQEYIITGPADTQFIPNYRQNQPDFNPFQQTSSGFQQIDSYLPQRDLQTSDLPYHLQQTLPQYRITTKSPPQYTFQPNFNFRSSQPAPFRPQENIVPSTHRPNYSHLFHSHNRNPSQTETFLGEITLQSPAELPPQYNEFQPSPFNPSSQESVNQNLDFTERPSAVQIGGGNRANFLNHRTRIFAPDSSKKPTLVKDYFVNSNGDVYITTKVPFVPKPTSSTSAPTTVHRRNPFSPATRGTNKPISFNLKSDKKPFVPKNPVTPRNGLDLESLLEEPIKSPSANSQNDDLVEIVKSKTTEEVRTEEFTTVQSRETTTDFDYETTLDPSTYYTKSKAPDSVKEAEEHSASHETSRPNLKEEHSVSHETTRPNLEEDHSDSHETTLPNSEEEEEEDYVTSHETIRPDSKVENHPESHETTLPKSKEETTRVNLKEEPEELSDLDELTQAGSQEEAPLENSKEAPEDATQTSEEQTDHEIPESAEKTTPRKTSHLTSQEGVEELSESEEATLPKSQEEHSEEIEDVSHEVTHSNKMPKESQEVDHTDSLEESDYITSEEEHEPTNSEENNDVRDDFQKHDEETTRITNSTSFEIVTTKPSAIVKDDNFHDFVDSAVIDNTEGPVVTVSDIPEKKVKSEALLSGPEFVVSVVTTKSVVNNTIVPTATPLPTATIGMDENSTDTWVVVASVQTSRSVSGARYLPSPIVEQDERMKLLNEEAEVAENTTEEVMTTLPPITKLKTSTESLIDKLDRVQSDLSSGLLTGGFNNEGNNIAVIKENMSDKIATTVLDLEITTLKPTPPPTTKSPLPAVQIRKFSPHARPSTTLRPKKVYDPSKRRTTTTVAPVNLDQPQGDEPPKHDNSTTGRSSGISNNTLITVQDVSAFLPPGYKSSSKDIDESAKLLAELLGKVKPSYKPESKNKTDLVEGAKKDDISGFLPPGYKPQSNITTKVDKILETAKQDDISKFLPPGFKAPNEAPKPDKIEVIEDDVSKFLPPGYKTFKTSTTEKTKPVESLFAKAKPVTDLSSLLPPGYKPPNQPKKGVEGLLAEAKPMDISAFLPPGYKARSTTQKPLTTVAEKVPTSLLPPGYNKFRESPAGTKHITTSSTSTTSKPLPSGGGFKVVFPSRPGGGARKSATRLTTPKASFNDGEEPRVTPPTIQKGWPSRATTEFSGWPSPPTTPISVEKLLEAARAASTSTTVASEIVTSTSTTTTTTTTTTTPKPTTPGICTGECDLAGTIKLIGGAKWAPELLDRNTKEWQLLANEVQTQLEDVFGKSNVLNKWYKKIRIDGFSEGSVLVDYLVELNDLGRQIDTLEIKKLFHDSLDDALTNPASNREAKSLNETAKFEGKLSLGRFVVDPKYTDFIVLPKTAYPTVGYAEDNVLLPQWAIAVIVIGLASLLFVIIFGVTVLVNRQKNAKKKAPVPLTEDMLNELNKNHMGGIDNYGAEDLYNMEDAWNDRGYEPKLAKKRSSGSIHDNSMSNLYDSWRSEWNGYYYNAYYGNNPGSSHGGYGRRRSDYDTNF